MAKNKPLACSDIEINKLEKELDLTLPKTYKAFLFEMGKGAGTFWKGSYFFYDDLRNIQVWAKELLEEDNFPIQLPDKAFVCFMHQGYQFSFFNSNEGDTSPIYYYCEGQEQKYFIKTHENFCDFLDTELHMHIKHRKNLVA